MREKSTLARDWNLCQLKIRWLQIGFLKTPLFVYPPPPFVFARVFNFRVRSFIWWKRKEVYLLTYSLPYLLIYLFTEKMGVALSSVWQQRVQRKFRCRWMEEVCMIHFEWDCVVKWFLRVNYAWCWVHTFVHVWKFGSEREFPMLLTKRVWTLGIMNFVDCRLEIIITVSSIVLIYLSTHFLNQTRCIFWFHAALTTIFLFFPLTTN